MSLIVQVLQERRWVLAEELWAASSHRPWDLDTSMWQKETEQNFNSVSLTVGISHKIHHLLIAVNAAPKPYGSKEEQSSHFPNVSTV